MGCTNQNKFTWDDSVKVVNNAPTIYRRGSYASVCGVDQVLFEVCAEHFECQVNDWLYIIEYSDGSSQEIAECYLEKWINE